MKFQKTLLSAALFATLAGCTTNPMTGRSQLSLVSEKQIIAQASSAYAKELSPWEKKGKVNNDPRLKARVDGITNRLIAQAVRYRRDSAQWDWQVTVIDDPETLNAYCLPGGRMAIYTGLIDKLHATDDEIAQVMGHEIGHALANHGAEKMSNSILAQGVVAVAAASSKNSNAVMQGGTAVAQLGWLLPNSRGAETEADRIGIEIAARAGFEPSAAVSLWKKMMAANGKGPPQFLSTHPAPDTRIKDLSALVSHMQPLYASASKAPVSALSRMPANMRDVTTNNVTPGAVAPETSVLTLLPINDKNGGSTPSR